MCDSRLDWYARFGCLDIKAALLECARNDSELCAWSHTGGRLEASVWHRILAEATPESIVRYERRTAWLGGEFPTDGIGFEIGDMTFFVPELVSVYDILPPSPNKDRTEIFVNDRNDEHCGLSLSGSASERLEPFELTEHHRVVDCTLTPSVMLAAW